MRAFLAILVAVMAGKPAMPSRDLSPAMQATGEYLGMPVPGHVGMPRYSPVASPSLWSTAKLSTCSRRNAA